MFAGALLWVELAVLLACIVVGARVGGIGLGAVSGVGLMLFIFVSATQHVIYALLPIIAEVSRKAGVRPERPLSISVIAAQQGLTASPISAVTVALVAALSGTNAGLPQILLVTIPATLLGTLAGVATVFRRGVELEDDPEYARRRAEGKIAQVAAVADLQGRQRRDAIGSRIVFFGAIALVVLLGVHPALRPVYESVVDGVKQTGQIEMGRAIMVVMLAAAGLIFLFFNVSPEAAVKGGVMKGGLVALISILGVSWLGSSFFEGNQGVIVAAISALVKSHAWMFAGGLFVLSILLMSQAATVVMMAPIAAAVGLSPQMLIGVYPAVNGTFFLPTYGTVLAAVSMDQTGTTRIGKYLVNHSFMLPGIVSTLASTASALLLSSFIVT